ncbi:hypothetical protein HanRHA438_Chr16g0788081 [Helianthus annuus]|nr:hypothetical protein HanRHA438_Chr16g0788081 [Helianthus annuus]
MDAHEWKESLDRIISTIAEMIDLLKNESRRWGTSPIFSTPLPSPVAATPPPTSVPVPTLPPPISATAPTTSATLKPTLFYPPIYTTSSVKPTVATLTCVFNQKATLAMEKKGSIIHLEGEDVDNRMLNHSVQKIKRGSQNVEATEETDLQPRVVAHLKWRP